MDSDDSTEMNTANLIHLLSNFTEINEKVQKIYINYLQKGISEHLAEQWTDWAPFQYELLKKFAFDPQKLMTIYSSYTQDYLALLEQTCSRLNNAEALNLSYSFEQDKRFSDIMWQEHPFFAFLKENYLLMTQYAQTVLDNIENINEKDKSKLRFYMQQIINAISPSNFIFTNPQILQATITSNGENIKKGLDNFIADIERNGQNFQIQMTDFSAFKIGENLALTSGKIIYQNELMQLIQYEPQTKNVYQVPLLIIPPWINKYYILDLSQQNSLVNWLVQQGYTVFMISWVNPDNRLAHKDFEDYLLQGPVAALDAIMQAIGIKKINALGYCIGGTLLACLLAYLTAKGDKRVVSGTYLATMLDFAEPGNLGILIDEYQIQLFEKQAKKMGFLDGASIAQGFNLLRSNDLIWNYFVKNYLQGEKPPPLDILYWNSDATNLPEKMLSFYLNNMYLHNRLIQSNAITLAQTPINLRAIKNPVYFVSTQQDHIAPWQSTYAGMLLHSGPTTFVLGGSGHIAGIINPPEKNKYYYYTNKRKYKNPASFLKTAQQQPGSWWSHWHQWLQQYSGGLVEARIPEQGQLCIIEEAPGRYVQVKFNLQKEIGSLLPGRQNCP